jgi:PAS domain S-box-containing protein
METIPTIEELKRFDTSHDLILSLTLNEEIIQFNKESERFTGYVRDEVLHKKLSELLIPTESTKQWKNLLESIQQNLWIDNFVLPIKTKDNQVHMITWTGFLVKTENGTVKDICIFGKPLKTEPMEKPAELPSEPVPEPKEPEEQPEIQMQMSSPPSETIPKRLTKEPAVKHGVNKIMFAREKKIIDEHTFPIASEKPIHPVESEKTNISVVTIEKQNDQTTKKLELIHQSLSELLQKYDLVSDRLEELEKKDRQTENKNKHLEAPRQPKKEDTVPLTKSQKTVTPDTLDDDQQQTEETEHSFFSDPFGFKRQHNELDLKKQRVELRMKELESFETRLMKEKDIFHARVEEFGRWQEKLMALESEIEKRRQELMEQENIIIEKRTSPPFSQRADLTRSEMQQKTESDVPACTDETLDKIPQSAAIIQRGILKQINTPFLELLGYNIDDIVEKSFFDFIALEGLADVEKYYLDRLKGDNVSAYRTVFSTKENIKVPVEVSIKQTIYNGEKAEIAIITCLNSHDVTSS